MLTKISGLLSGYNSINNLFAQCYILADIDELTFDFKNVSTASSTFDRCYRLKNTYVEKNYYKHVVLL